MDSTGLRHWILGIIVVGTLLAIFSQFVENPAQALGPVLEMVPGKTIEDKIDFSVRHVPSQQKFRMSFRVPSEAGTENGYVTFYREYKDGDNAVCQTYKDVLDDPDELKKFRSGEWAELGMSDQHTSDACLKYAYFGNIRQCVQYWTAMICCASRGGMTFTLDLKKDMNSKDSIKKVRKYKCTKAGNTWRMESY